MAGLVTAEKHVIANPADNYGYTAEQRALSASIRSVVPVADRAEATAIMNAMAADGRPVTDANPLFVWRLDLRCLEVKTSASAWATTAQRIAVYKGGALTIPANTMWGLGGSLTEDVTAAGSVNNDFVTTSGEVHTFARPGTYSITTILNGGNPPPAGWLGFRKGDDSIVHSEIGIPAASAWSFTHQAVVNTRTANEQVRLRIYLPTAWNLLTSVTTIVKLA